MYTSTVHTERNTKITSYEKPSEKFLVLDRGDKGANLGKYPRGLVLSLRDYTGLLKGLDPG